MSKTYIVETDDETQLIVEIGVNSTGAALIATNPVSFLTPYTEPDIDAICKGAYNEGYQDAYDIGYQDAVVKIGSDEQAIEQAVAERVYQRGLNDAWDAARKIESLSACEFDKAFTGYDDCFKVFENYTPQEAIKKIKQCGQEQEEIRVGDEVIGIYSSGEQTKPFVITKGNSDYYFGIYSDSGEFCQGGLKLQKTGRHFPEIAEVLRKMQEEKE